MFEYCRFGENWELEEEATFAGELFHQFIEIIFEKSDSFSLCDSQWLNSENLELEKERGLSRIQGLVMVDNINRIKTKRRGNKISSGAFSILLKLFTASVKKIF